MPLEVYALLAILVALVFGLLLVIKRLDEQRRQAEAGLKRQDDALAALREQVKVAAEKMDQRLLRQMEADAKAQAALDAVIRAEHAALEANSRAIQQLAGVVGDLRVALLDVTKL